jgi:predicted kinase
MNKPILTLMCGLPRSGKSTWVKKNKKKNEVVVCPDEIRLELFGHIFHSPSEPFIWSITEFFIKSLMKQKINIILDACNLTMTIHRWIDIARKNNYKVNLIVIDTKFDICLKRNEKDKKIPLEVLLRFPRLKKDNIDYMKKNKEFNKVVIIKFPN